MSKVRFNGLPLNNTFSELVSKVHTVWKEMHKKDPALENEVFWQSVQNNKAVVSGGLSTSIR